MRQLHESPFSGAQRRLGVAEQSLPTNGTELIHAEHAWHCETASVCSSTYFQHIYQLLFYAPLYSLLALYMNSISNSAALSLRVSGLTLLGTNVIPPPPQSHLCTTAELLLWNQWFFICWWICKSSYRLAPAQSSFFTAPAYFHHCFSRCAVGERGQTHPFTEWHSMRRRKGEEKSCLVLPLMSKSMHLSLKRWRKWERERSYWDPKDQAKTLTQKQLPHAMNRSLF